MKSIQFLASLIFLFLAWNMHAQPELIIVDSGEILLGCTNEQKPDCDGDEFPVHATKLDEFLIGKFEITQAEWEAVMGDNPSGNTACGANCPVENIDWYSMLVFCNQLTLSDPDLGAGQLVYFRDEALSEPWTLADYNGNGDTAGSGVFLSPGKKGYRLPTEAEWEFAARGGNASMNYKYAGSNNIEEIAWYQDNAGDTTHPVGEKASNELGIYDMTGNVWERVFDFQGDYMPQHQCNPTGPEDGENRIYRGGSYFFDASYCRVADRYFNKPTRNSSNVGFRIARNQ